METKELKITIPEGQEIDWQESAKQEKIVFKKKDTKPRNWKEYCHTRLNSKETRFGYRIGNACDIVTTDWDNLFNYSTYKDVLPSKELAEAFLAMMQLMSLRQAWIGEWKPNYKKGVKKWGITFHMDKIIVDCFMFKAIPLSFPTEEMTYDFMNTFKDLLEIAKPLI